MAAALEDRRFIFSVEIHPPRSPDIEKTIQKVAELKAAGVDLINIPDGPRASARLSAMVLASQIRQRVGIDTILHFTCRDRNILGMQSDLLGAEVLGLDNILCVTGDPPKLGDYPMATAVYDVDAIGLLRIADNLNHGLDLAGNPIPRGASFHLGCGANPVAIDLEKEIDRLHRKIENGARFVLTQPVFDVEKFFHFLDRLNIRNLPVLVGILPLASYRNAEFFHNEVPGMEVPEHIRARLKEIHDAEAAAAIGVEIAAEALLRCAPRAAGAYIMPPFGRTQLALEVIEKFRQSDYGKARLEAV
jgi:homocysteine S-methyltransferase